MNIWKRIQNLDRRIIFTLLAIFIAFPLLRPLGLPVNISPGTRAYHQAIEDLNPGDRVIMSLEIAPSTASDVFPDAQAVFRHLMDRKIRVILVTFGPQGALYTESLALLGEERGGQYGEDFVAMGYVPGLETGLSAFVNNLKGTIPVDLRGTSTEGMPILDGVTDAGDVQAYLGFSDGIPGPFEYVRQVQQFGIPILASVVTVMGPQTEPYVNSGQIKGLLVGLRGAAEYELLSENPGSALAGMDAQSAGHVLIILFIMIGNVAYVMSRGRKGGANPGGDNQ